MFCEYMFRCYLFLFILLFSTSSIFELHVVVAGTIMFNILELIIEIMPNYPTPICVAVISLTEGFQTVPTVNPKIHWPSAKGDAFWTITNKSKLDRSLAEQEALPVHHHTTGRDWMMEVQPVMLSRRHHHGAQQTQQRPHPHYEIPRPYTAETHEAQHHRRRGRRTPWPIIELSRLGNGWHPD
jgi:hypothetical protein